MTQSEEIREIIRKIPEGQEFNLRDIKKEMGGNLNQSQNHAISNILREFVKLGIIKKEMHALYIRQGKTPIKPKTVRKKKPVTTKMSFSDMIRKEINDIPAGAKYNKEYVYKKLNLKKDDYSKRAVTIREIKKSIRFGKTEEIDNYYKKTGDGNLDLRDFSEAQMIIYRGEIVYEYDFKKLHKLTQSQLKQRISYGFYKGFAIFKTKDKEDAEYYAREFCNVKNIDGDIEMDA